MFTAYKLAQNTGETSVRHIGIVGTSPEGAALCYTTICKEAAEILGDFRHPEVTLHTFSLENYMKHFTDDNNIDWVSASAVLANSVDKLKTIGADFAICADNGIHHSLDMIRDRLSLPCLHICEVTVEEGKARSMEKLLILGASCTMRGSIYQRVLDKENLEYITPNEKEIREVERVIWEELYTGRIEEISTSYFQGLIQKYKEQGCDGVILGCTELPLLINDEISPLPCLDSTRLLARKAISIALSDDPVNL